MVEALLLASSTTWLASFLASSSIFLAFSLAWVTMVLAVLWASTNTFVRSIALFSAEEAAAALFLASTSSFSISASFFFSSSISLSFSADSSSQFLSWFLRESLLVWSSVILALSEARSCSYFSLSSMFPPLFSRSAFFSSSSFSRVYIFVLSWST